MQKKLYYLDESEKNRILNLHEDRTRKQYLLKEQLSYNLQPSEEEKVKNDLFNNRVERKNKLNTKCSSIRGTDENNKIYLEIINKVDKIGGAYFYWPALKSALAKISSLKDYCIISNTLKINNEANSYGKNLADYLYDKIYTIYGWNEYFEEPLSNVLKEVEGKKIETNTDTSKNGEDKKTNSTSKLYSLSNYIKKSLGSNDDSPSKPITNYKQEIGVVQQSKVAEFNQILKNLGVGDTLNQDSINKLYTKLGGK